MAKILQFTAKASPKFGFERVKKKKKKSKKDTGQLNLFSSQKGKVLHLSSKLSPFEEALLLDERNDKHAVESYLKAISVGDCPADAYCNLGILESKINNTTKAFDCFTKSLKENPRHFESHYNLANLYFDANNLELAKVHYQIAEEIDESFPNLHFNLGLVLALQENYKFAVEQLNKYKSLTQNRDTSEADELIENINISLTLQSES